MGDDLKNKLSSVLQEGPQTPSPQAPRSNAAPPLPSPSLATPLTLPFTIAVCLTDGVFKVKIEGEWQGHFIKGAIRAIEKEYKAIKHRQTKLGLQRSAAEKLAASAVPAKGA